MYIHKTKKLTIVILEKKKENDVFIFYWKLESKQLEETRVIIEVDGFYKCIRCVAL